ncbi:MAG: carboxypeptidase regulatory-like domain-containing protein [Candidatus Sumerlaeaceae bacterium]
MIPRILSSAILFGLMSACLLLLTGCNNQPGSVTTDGTQRVAGKLGTLEGQVLLSVPDSITSHTGIVVYLAGTSFLARTSASGAYRIDNLPAGSYQILAEKNDFQITVVDNLVLDPARHTPQKPAITKVAILEALANSGTRNGATDLGTVQGTVYLQGQEKSDGVRVQLEGTQFVTVSGDDGSYRLLNVQPGTYSITFTRVDYKPYKATGLVVAAGSATTVPDTALESTHRAVLIGTPSMDNNTTVPATPVGTPIVASRMSGDRVISGIVQLSDLEGKPVTDYNRAMVAINDSDIVATLDEEGRFRMANLAPGIYTLIGSLDNGEATRLPVDLTTQQTATVILKISAVTAPKPKGAITGRVVLPGIDDEPMPDASGVRIGIAGTQSTALSAADGSFKLQDVPEGSYQLVATKDGFEDFSQGGVEVAGGSPTDVGVLTLEPKRDYPRVIGTVPQNGTRNVPVGLDILLQVKFSKRMDPAKIREAVSVRPPTAAQVLFGRGSHPLADDDALVVVLSSLSEDAPIRFGTNYQLAIARTATDVDGVPMREDFAMNFSTGAPGIIGTRPGNGEQNVYADQNTMPVLLNFNTRLKPDSLNERSIRVRPDNGISISITHTEDPRNGWTNVRVATQWQPDTQYTITIGRDVRAANGQPLGNTPYTLKFRTSSNQVIQQPIQVVR